ncbi:MAG: 3D domain-containing protein [Bdellovibrio sp.]|jgi:hypothetical protein
MAGKRTHFSQFTVLPALTLALIVSICETGSARRASGGNRWGIPADGIWCKDAKAPKKPGKKRSRDNEEVTLASSIYNVPRQGVTRSFGAAVRMNGTGLIGANGDTKVTYDNSRPQPNVAANGSRCEGSIGSVAGSGGMCLTPFFSVAADPSKYSIGDVICIPGLKGKKMKVTATRSVRHTGCLIVGDKGAAIKGENRFDFFTGTVAQGPANPFNEFIDKKSCAHQFTVHRAGSSEADAKMVEIDEAWQMDTGTLKKRYQAGHQRAARIVASRRAGRQ